MKKDIKAGKVNEYDHLKIEKKWQKKWSALKLYKTKEEKSKKTNESESKKFYILDMFPYPSGEGLHVGHPKGYIATDVYSRFKRMQGYNVLHPMGFDAFGLPAENYAIKMKMNPADMTAKNVKRYKEQLEILGFDYDWSREINTTDPKYYKWTQWIFLQLFKKGLAYESYEPINWCPSCKTGLANEDVEDGKCERCGTIVEKKPMRQWVLKITDYAEKLLAGIDEVEYERPKVIDNVNPHIPGKPIVTRYVAHAIVFDPKNRKYLIIRNKKHGWDTVVIGGIEKGEKAEETAMREVREETGYIDLEFKRILGGETEAQYYTKHKGENRIAIAKGVYFELKSDKRIEIAEGEDKDNEILWIDEKDFVPGKMVNSELPIWLERIKDPTKGWPVPVLNWPDSIKELQRNWIGKSEGAEIDFKVKIGDRISDGKNIKNIKVFTTRPDTIFGVTYVVLAPESPLVSEFVNSASNKSEIEKYVSEAKKKTEIDRTDAKKEKTGVEIKGIKAINPANNEEIPVYVADYVLAEYGTGAVMAVPAHDDRDWDFAKKYNLPIKYVIAPYFFDDTEACIPRKDKKDIKRTIAISIIKHWSRDEYLCLDWKVNNWKTFLTGGVENGESFEDGAKREIYEETGYKNIKFIKHLGGQNISYFYTPHKDVNQFAEGRGMYFELINDEKDDITEEEKKKHDLLWIPKEKVLDFIKTGDRGGDQRYLYLYWNRLLTDRYTWTDSGKMINSGNFDGRNSNEVMKEITKSIGGEWVNKYKLREWVFSRQRYWGEPIPLIHCEKCGVVAVPEKDLPVKLPKVKFYEPTGTGESPLAGIAKWVNVKCPKCKGKAKRETNTMPQWAGSSWYYLRYMDPKNSKAFVDHNIEKFWSPVDLYVGGAEHATRHLIYARFWHRFLYDNGFVSTPEPFRKLQHVGLIMAEDGRKMSKRWSNVVNPDDIVKTYGADTMRLYEMFMGPFDQSIAWNTSSMVGMRRFLERVWRISEKVEKSNNKKEKAKNSKDEQNTSDLPSYIHKAIKKVGEDISDMKYNTAVSTLMIALNEIEKNEKISQSLFSTFLKLLAPFAPHITEELWTNLGNKKSIHLESWPVCDESKLVEKNVKIIVQINGKVRWSLEADSSLSKGEIEALILENEIVKKWISGKKIIKQIFIPGKLLSIVTD